MKSLILYGIFLLGICSAAAESSADNNSVEGMQSDDYYIDEASSDSGSLQPTKPVNSKAFFKGKNSTVTAIAGKDIQLHCEIINFTNEVVLWYKDKVVVANDGNVMHPMYAVDKATHTLTIINPKDDSQGEYVCEIQPGKMRLYTKVVISHKPLDITVPESSPSMMPQDITRQHGSGSLKTATESIFFLAVCCMIQTILRL